MSENESRPLWRVRVRCPGCKGEACVPPGFVGRVGLCPGCLDPLRVPDPGRPPKRAQAAIAALPPLDLPPLEPEVLERARWGIGVSWVEAQPQQSAPDGLHAHCRVCGEPIRARALVCDHCGEFQSDTHVEERTGVMAAAPYKRAAAFFLNLLLLAPSIVSGFLAWGAWTREAWAPLQHAVPLTALSGVSLALVVYFQLRFSLRHSASVGKRVVGLRVIRGDGSPATLAEGVLLREGMFWILLTPLCAGLGLVVHGLSALLVFSGQPRALHDMLSGTLVVEAGSESAPRTSSLPGPKELGHPGHGTGDG